MLTPILEVVIYEIKPDFAKGYRLHHLPRFQELVKNLPGFISFRTLGNCNQHNLYLDLVEWKSLEHAVSAANSIQQIQKSKEYQGYLEAFDKVKMFHHFKPL
ncbi:antibiotic biosynthesis monooxygenase [Aliikangiella sp. G2MR2-5]|uniref:antibiotic biosynthesis monooxygenase family protein n=1 Tax=Aliikangiella sp. G2MR2-5 TaxID=2788943 RepID=UPI0018A94A83|nr:hypothetical protein [Aliikangiella sp. G2MR2-5]